MTLIAHYECDEQDNAAGALIDSSGHANNHDAQLTIPDTSGFDHKRVNTVGNLYSSAPIGNSADLALSGNLTVVCWLEMLSLVGSGWDNPQWIIGFGNGTSEAQADNHLWGLRVLPGGIFGLYWEHSAGVDVVASSPAGALDPAGDNFDGQTRALHIACIRSINGAQRDVKFVVNGVDLAADVTGLTAPDGGGNGVAEVFDQPGAFGYRVNGGIASIRVYDTAEIVNTIQAIYNSEKATHENATRSGRPFSFLGTTYQQSGPQGSIYLPRHTGTELDPVLRPNSGWAGVRP